MSTTVTSAQLKSLRSQSTAGMKGAVGSRLRQAAGILADAARDISGAFSRRTAASMKITGCTTEVYIVAGGEGAPMAAPFENGSDHPVFARGPRYKWTWRPQPHRPFLEEAVASAGDAAAEQFSKILDDWIAEL
jgi:hypothetical protein